MRIGGIVDSWNGEIDALGRDRELERRPVACGARLRNTLVRAQDY